MPQVRTEICGYPTINGPCRNPKNCRFHKSKESKIDPKYFVRVPVNKGAWTPEEHNSFLQAVKYLGLGRWHEISAMVTTRTPGQCQIHYFKQKQRLGISDEEYMTDIDKYGPNVLTPTSQKKKQKDKLKIQQPASEYETPENVSLHVSNSESVSLFTTLGEDIIQYINNFQDVADVLKVTNSPTPVPERQIIDS